MLTSILPAPKFSNNTQAVSEPTPNILPSASNSRKTETPRYPNRKGFIPVNLEDFGDGGAYPEIHIVQYPLNMGKPGSKSTAIVALDVDDKGQLRFDAIVKQGTNKNKIVQTSMNDLKEKSASESALALPSEEEEQLAVEKTKKALENLLNSKISASKPLNSAHTKEGEAQFIRYTPNPNAPGFNASAQERVIKMVEAQIDPMEPPKHPYKKVPRGPAEDPVPILHSPPRKLTVADQQAWKIPPAISNWKNARGFIIPLDKRLAADGRGLQEITINNKFATLSEALYVAERKAAEELRIRSQIRKKMSIQEKEDREKELREMAVKARMERAGVLNNAPRPGASEDHGHYGPSSDSPSRLDDQNSYEEKSMQRSRRNDSDSSDGDSNSRGADRRGHAKTSRRTEDSGSDFDSNDEASDADELEEGRRERIEREKLRIQRRKERERELRMENMKGNMKKSKMEREENRDISEKIALGLHKGTGKLTGESMFDSRLFNQSAGMSSGFGNEDEYNVFSKPLFDRGEAGSIYRPKKSDSDVYGDADAQLAKLSDTSRFKPDKGFQGSEGGVHTAGRDAPVQFEKGSSSHRSDDDDDKKPPKRSRFHD